jgi:hypothetical protein
MPTTKCDAPGCTEDHDTLYLHGRCHPDSPTWTKIVRLARGSVAVVECAECNRTITQLLLA